jgi:hypothetical protein
MQQPAKRVTVIVDECCGPRPTVHFGGAVLLRVDCPLNRRSLLVGERGVRLEVQRNDDATRIFHCDSLCILSVKNIVSVNSISVIHRPHHRLVVFHASLSDFL